MKAVLSRQLLMAHCTTVYGIYFRLTDFHLSLKSFLAPVTVVDLCGVVQIHDFNEFA